MSSPYRMTYTNRIANAVMKVLIRVGLGSPHTFLLTVRGRKTGKLQSTPITLVEEQGQRWLVAPYGAVQWVKNVRAAGEVTLSRSGRSQTCKVVECQPQESGPVLKRYLEIEPITQPAFEARRGAPDEAFVAEAARHPVFRIV